MRRQVVISITLMGLFIGSLLHEPLDSLLAQENQDTYLPLVSGSQNSNGAETPIATGNETATAAPGQTAEATPTATPTTASVNQFEAAWNLPPTATSTATPIRTYPDWLPGTYNVRQKRSEGWAEYRADGTYSERYATFGSETIGTEEGEWFVIEGANYDQIVVTYTDENGDIEKRRYLIEQAGNGDFRISAGDAKVYSFLYERFTPIKAFDGENVSRWVQGRWNLTLFLDFNSFFFAEDGTYEMYKIYSFDEPEGDPEETGRWSAFGNKMIIQPEGESLENSTYTILSATDGWLNLTGGRIGEGDSGMLRGTFERAESMEELEGQYSAGSTTVNVEKGVDDTYTAQILTNGEITEATGTVNESGWLTLTSDEREYDPLVPYFNALNYDSFHLPGWLTKMSTSRLPEPDSLQGMWVDQDSSSSSEKWLLPNGRYFDIFGSVQTEGTYNVTDETITFDPLCGSPSERSYIWAENQLVFPGRTATLTNHYVPLKLPDLMAEVARFDESRAVANLDFATNTAPLGNRDGAFITPATSEVAVDVNRENVFADSIVFAEQQLYTWPQTATYYLDGSGNLVLVTPFTCALGGCAGLDLSQGWTDKFHYWFFPNGRVAYYHESYLGAISLSPVTPAITRTWGKYKIEDEQITIETDLGETLIFDMTIGRRRALLGEICFENFEWTIADDGQ